MFNLLLLFFPFYIYAQSIQESLIKYNVADLSFPNNPYLFQVISNKVYAIIYDNTQQHYTLKIFKINEINESYKVLL